jgi:hypothetical protein
METAVVDRVVEGVVVGVFGVVIGVAIGVMHTAGDASKPARSQEVLRDTRIVAALMIQELGTATKGAVSRRRPRGLG